MPQHHPHHHHELAPQPTLNDELTWFAAVLSGSAPPMRARTLPRHHLCDCLAQAVEADLPIMSFRDQVLLALDSSPLRYAEVAGHA